MAQLMILLMSLKGYKSVLVIGSCLFLYALYAHQRASSPEKMPIIGVDFEVFGKVQGVFFRKYTQKKAEELAIRGWCMNTKTSTVIGRIEGEKSKIEEMKHWLRNTGSPQSAISKAEFKNEQPIPESTFPTFSIKK